MWLLQKQTTSRFHIDWRFYLLFNRTINEKWGDIFPFQHNKKWPMIPLTRFCKYMLMYLGAVSLIVILHVPNTVVFEMFEQFSLPISFRFLEIFWKWGKKSNIYQKSFQFSTCNSSNCVIGSSSSFGKSSSKRKEVYKKLRCTSLPEIEKY